MAPDEDRSRAAAGYRHGPPWVFKGRQGSFLFLSFRVLLRTLRALLMFLGGGSALYQLHLVKASTARAFVPPELRLVEAFGYTLGGMFLARYHDSPAGEFDEVRCCCC